jgi:hypothetical protein
MRLHYATIRSPHIRLTDALTHALEFGPHIKSAQPENDILSCFPTDSASSFSLHKGSA